MWLMSVIVGLVGYGPFTSLASNLGSWIVTGILALWWFAAGAPLGHLTWDAEESKRAPRDPAVRQ
jgi:hypothetical protein